MKISASFAGAVLRAAPLFLAAMLAALFPLFATDTACRYAPMAEAFAEGNWSEAFHPRFGVGFPVIAGLIRFVTRCDGYSACATASTLAWAFGAWPVYGIASRIWDRRVAWFAVILYVLCPQPLVWALKGLREPFKMLGALMMTDAIISARSQSWRAAAKAVVALFLLFMFKCDAIALGGVLAFVLALLDGFRWRTLVVALSGALALQPMCVLVYAWTGYWLPAPHYVPLWQKAFGG